MRLRPEGLIARVVATDQPVLAETVPAELDLMWHEVYPTLAEELAPLTAYSAMVVPLRAVDGMAGALFLVSLQATRRYDADDLRIAVELADRVGQTLERVRLYEAALVARDAAEASERRLRAARERFTAAFEHAPVGMALIEPAGPSGPTLVEVNTALCDLSGYAYDELIGRDPVDVLLHPDERPQVRAALAGLAPGGTTTYRAERRWVNRAGETLWVQVHVALIGGPNGPQVVFQAQDVTERHRVEETQRRINEELERRVAARTAEVRSVNRELEAANRELEAFSYSAAHDLRAPLRAIDGFAAALAAEQAGALPPGALHYVELVRQGAREMSALIDDLLAFSRVGLQAMHVERVEPRALVVAAVQDLADQRAGRAVEIAVGDLPPLAADPRLLALVYRNLLANSLKFTRGRTPARIEVGFDPAVAGGVYYVRDNGIGFDAADAEQIFNVFRRLHPAEAYEGTGVGLALVKRIVERHGGAIWAESEDGVGATFYFRLDPPASEPAEPVTGAARGSAEPRSGRR
jgi:PAS domain S-box-containing protein